MNGGVIQLRLQHYQQYCIDVGDGEAGVILPGAYLVFVASVPNVNDANGRERAEQRKDFEIDDLLPWSEEMKSWFSAV